jgi:hypothetical protein
MKLLTAIIVLFLAAPAYATCTWTASTNVAGVQGACSATEGAAPTKVTDGTTFGGTWIGKVTGFTVVIDAGASTMTATTLLCWVFNPATNVWSRMPDWDLSVQALTSQSFYGIPVPHAPAGVRIAWQPAAAGQTNTVYIIPSGT